MAFPLIAGIIGGSLISGASSLIGSDKAADAAKEGAAVSTAENRRQYDQTRADFLPQIQLGQGATSLLARLYGIGMPATSGIFDAQRYLAENPDVAAGEWSSQNPEEHYRRWGMAEGRASPYISGAPATGGQSDASAFIESPEYQFNLAQGQQAIDRSLAARGRSLSGAGVKEGIRYASGMASNEFGNFTNRLMQIAGLGSAATSNVASVGQNTTNNITGATMNAANARATGYMTAAQGVNNAVQGGISNFLLSRYLSGGTT